MLGDHAAERAHRIGNVGQKVGQAVAVKIGRQDDAIALFDQVPQHQAEIRIGDMLFDPATPVFHAFLEVLGQQGDDAVHGLLVLDIAVDGVFATNLELGALQHPGMQTGIDAVFHRLGRLHGDTAKLAGLVHHFQEQAVGIGHLHAR